MLVTLMIGNTAAVHKYKLKTVFSAISLENEFKNVCRFFCQLFNNLI